MDFDVKIYENRFNAYYTPDGFFACFNYKDGDEWVMCSSNGRAKRGTQEVIMSRCADYTRNHNPINKRAVYVEKYIFLTLTMILIQEEFIE